MRLLITIVIIAEYAAILAGRIDPLVFYLTAFVLLFVFRSHYIILLGATMGLLLDLFQPLPGIYFITYPLMLTLSNEALRRVLTHRSAASYLVMYLVSSFVYIGTEITFMWAAQMATRSPLSIDILSIVEHQISVIVIWMVPGLALYAVLRKCTEIRYGYGIESGAPTVRHRV